MRIRTIKPDFFLHVPLFDLESETSLPLRLAYAGLWCAADREGRFAWEPRKLKAQILPYDDVDFSRVLHALTTRGFVVRYASGTREFGWIPSFTRHQVVNNRERPSEIPAPPDGVEQQPIDACPTRAPRDDDACLTVLNPALVEGKGREQGREVCTPKPPEPNGSPVKRPNGIPSSEDQAVEWASMENVPPDFSRQLFHQCEGVGWVDGVNRPILSWRSYARHRFSVSQTMETRSKHPTSIMDIKSVIAIKEEKAKKLRDQYYNDGPVGGSWNNEESRKAWVAIRGEIKTLKQRIEEMV